jgi:hypothetical protein
MVSLSQGRVLATSLILSAVGLAAPGMLVAQAPGPGVGAPCVQPPCGPAPCAAPAPCCASTCCPCPQPPDICTCTTFRPVCETTYRNQSVVGFHDVCHTCYRQEAYCVTVPVTRMQCVTCDEGCYKMVWCPRIVTRQVPRTEFRQQVCTRAVPYTVSQRVPHVTNVCVPECHTHYVPQTNTFLKCPTPCPAPCCPAPCCPGPGCAGGVPLTQNSPAAYALQTMAAAPPAQSQQPVALTAEPQANLAPVPYPDAAAANQQVVQTGAQAPDPAYLRAQSIAAAYATNRPQ